MGNARTVGSFLLYLWGTPEYIVGPMHVSVGIVWAMWEAQGFCGGRCGFGCGSMGYNAVDM